MKILILHASFGAGHKRAAQALQESFRETGHEVDVRDLLEFLPRPLAKFYSFSYVFMIHKARLLWQLLYKGMDRSAKPYAPSRSLRGRWQFKGLRKFLQQEKYDVILCTHFTPAALVTDWKQDGVFDSDIYSIVTDHVAHRCWKRTGLNHYFVPSQAVADQLSRAGIPGNALSISGIPVSSLFCVLPDRAKAREAWNCPANAIVVLVLCSALTYSRSLRILNEIGSFNGNLFFLVSAGPDSEKEKRIKDAFQGRSNFVIFGFSPKMPELMAAADLIITKPGGLIVSEALAAGKPQILYSPIPGQEEANATYAEQSGAALCIRRVLPGKLKNALSQTLSDPDRITQMSQAAKKAGKPAAAKEIVQYIMSVE